MKERPIIFSARMVKALLAGTKTQTRRVVKPIKMHPDYGSPLWDKAYIDNSYPPIPLLKVPYDGGAEGRTVQRHWFPYGDRIGARLWVKESFCGHWYSPASELSGALPVDPERILTSGESVKQDDGEPSTTSPEKPLCLYYRATYGEIPPLTHLKWKSPLFMPRWACRITLEITEVRVERVQSISEKDAKSEGVWGIDEPYQGVGDLPTDRFESLWHQLHGNGPGSWESNPWCWAISFKRVAS